MVFFDFLNGNRIDGILQTIYGDGIMARHKEFDPDEVLDRAMLMFWENGYANTSVQNLAHTLRIGKGSLYNAFGNKHALFLKTLDRYAETGIAMCEKLLAQYPPRIAVGRILRRIVNDAMEDKKCRGCFIINASAEKVANDPAVADRILRNHQRQLACFSDAFQRAVTHGLMSPEHDPRALALFFVNTMKGLRIMARMGPRRKDLQAVVDTALKLL